MRILLSTIETILSFALLPLVILLGVVSIPIRASMSLRLDDDFADDIDPSASPGE